MIKGATIFAAGAAAGLVVGTILGIFVAIKANELNEKITEGEDDAV